MRISSSPGAPDPVLRLPKEPDSDLDWAVYGGPADLVTAAESAARDLRASVRVTGDLTFVADEAAQTITVEATLAETPQEGTDR